MPTEQTEGKVVCGAHAWPALARRVGAPFATLFLGEWVPPPVSNECSVQRPLRAVFFGT